MVKEVRAGTWESFTITEIEVIPSTVLAVGLKLLDPDSIVSLKLLNSDVLASEEYEVLVFSNPISTKLNMQLVTKGEKVVLSIVGLKGSVLGKNEFQTY